MKRPLAILLLLLTPSLTQAAVRHVPAAYSTIQEGIDAASVGDTVLVAPGTYAGAGNRDLDFNGKDIVLKGDGLPEAIVIDCNEEGRGIYLHSGETSAAIITCLSIVHGFPQNLGSGILVEHAAATIDNVVIDDCLGGGLRIRFASNEVMVGNSLVRGNWASYSGGGIIVDDSVVSLSNLIIQGNSSNWGGGISIGQTMAGSTDVTITDCVIRDNLALNDGGGLYCDGYENTTVRINNVEFLDNTANDDGGGMYFTGQTTFEIEGCLFQGNHAGRWAGGFWVNGWYNTQPLGTCWVKNSLIVDNASDHGPGGLGVYDHIDPILENLTVVGNESSATTQSAVFIGMYAEPELVSCIIVGNDGLGIWVDYADPIINCCDVWGNSGMAYGGTIEDQTGANGNISENPLFCGSLGGDEPLSLQASSPCLPENNGCAVLIGALGLGCDTTATDDATWSEIKSLYK